MPKIFSEIREALTKRLNLKLKNSRSHNRSFQRTGCAIRLIQALGLINHVQRHHQHRRAHSQGLCYSQNNNLAVFYRGHSNRDKYKLEPSLYRNQGHKDSEHILFRELLIANPTDFIGDSSAFEKLVRMQHYSRGTRTETHRVAQAARCG